MKQSTVQAHQELGEYMDEILTARNRGTLDSTDALVLFALSYARKERDHELGKSDYHVLVDSAREDSRALLYDAMESGRPIAVAMLASVGTGKDVKPLFIPQYSVISGDTDFPVVFNYAQDTLNKRPVLVKQIDSDKDTQYVLDTVYIKNPFIPRAIPMDKDLFVMLDFNKKENGMPTITDINHLIDKVINKQRKGHSVRP
jgi:hypothetical protein